MKLDVSGLGFRVEGSRIEKNADSFASADHEIIYDQEWVRLHEGQITSPWVHYNKAPFYTAWASCFIGTISLGPLEQSACVRAPKRVWYWGWSSKYTLDINLACG